jgi:hypothetical protein
MKTVLNLITRISEVGWSFSATCVIIDFGDFKTGVRVFLACFIVWILAFFIYDGMYLKDE